MISDGCTPNDAASQGANANGRRWATSEWTWETPVIRPSSSSGELIWIIVLRRGAMVPMISPQVIPATTTTGSRSVPT